MSTPPPPLRRSDYLLLAGYTVLLLAFPLVFNRALSTHETVHCVNIREMRADGDLVIPHYGGRPWLERPPLPFWLTLPLVEAFGDAPAVYRLAEIPIAVLCVLLVGWMGSVFYGRAVGLLSGLVLATIREFTYYGTSPQCDLFLYGVVTCVMACFVYLEFCRRPADGEGGFVGRRSWALVGFFFFLGLTNLVKGLFFGDVMALLPVVGFLFLGSDRWSLLKRYVWLPGWLVFAATAAAWATAAYLRYPDIVELWKSDYVGRMNQGYMREPPWYYLIELPWVLFPWTLVIGAGLAVTWPRVTGQGRTPERLLWVWALLPVAFLSVPQGKHHHYLLHTLTPWAILGAVGAVRVWAWLPQQEWVRRPWPMLTIASVAGMAAVVALNGKFHLPAWFLPAALVGWPLVVFACWRIAAEPDLLKGSIALFAFLVPAHWFGHAMQPLLANRYTGDLAFIERLKSDLPADARLLVGEDIGPLDASWMLFYLRDRGEQLHNFTFLRDRRLQDAEVYVIARRMVADRLKEYGRPELVFESGRSRDEGGPEHRFGLYRVRFHDRLARRDGDVYISPMQATGRAPGPELR
ncbi:MAG: hypothetical protein U0736_10850 [Gemmataceae bacterium]